MQVYDSTKQLRYGHLMIMTDQDHDGSHIKGLIMNFLHHFYPSLLQVNGFLLEFITPIVKVRALAVGTLASVPMHHVFTSFVALSQIACGMTLDQQRPAGVQYRQGAPVSAWAVVASLPNATSCFCCVSSHLLDMIMPEVNFAGYDLAHASVCLCASHTSRSAGCILRYACLLST